MNKQFQIPPPPKVTILMSVYNGERYLREAIDSILNQTFRDFEFLIINDGSTDRTKEILDSYKDPRIRVINNEKNIGLTKSLNKGLRLAKGEYIARMDADDISLPERLSTQAIFLDAHPDIGALGSAVQIINGCGIQSSVLRFPADHGFLRWCLCFYDPIPHPSAMMRKKAMEQVGGYASDMMYAQDYDLWRRLSVVTRLATLPDVLLYLRKHEESLTERHLMQQRKNSIKTSQKVMSDMLGKDIPIDVVKNLWNLKFRAVNDARRTAKLISNLYRVCVTDGTLSIAENRMIQKDVVSRLLALVRPRVYDVRLWPVFAFACRLDPLTFARGVIQKIRRKIEGRFYLRVRI